MLLPRWSHCILRGGRGAEFLVTPIPGAPPHHHPARLSIYFLLGSDVGERVPVKAHRGRGSFIKWSALFPFWDFEEVTEKILEFRVPGEK